jgi:hypothetical protein
MGHRFAPFPTVLVMHPIENEERLRRALSVVNESARNHFLETASSVTALVLNIHAIGKKASPPPDQPRTRRFAPNPDRELGRTSCAPSPGVHGGARGLVPTAGTSHVGADNCCRQRGVRRRRGLVTARPRSLKRRIGSE